MLLYKLIKVFKPKELNEFLEQYLWPFIKELPRPNVWRHAPSTSTRSSYGYAGIKNLGQICYMNSMLQQLYMVPQFRYSLFKAINTNPPDMKEHKEQMVDDNLLRNFQKLFGFLELTSRQSMRDAIFDFCYSLKDWGGEPTNTSRQEDSNEFFQKFTTQMEEALKTTSQKYLLQDIFQGTTVEVKVCMNEECKHTSYRIEDFCSLPVEVKNKHFLDKSLEAFIDEEKIDDFKCEKCEKKGLKKRTLIGKTPNILIVNPKRFSFNYNTFENDKINDAFEFPPILDLSNYTFKKNQVKAEAYEDEKLNDLLKQGEDEFKYRLAGVVIHRGTGKSGHYWSVINTNRDKPLEDQDWLKTELDTWRRFDDETIGSSSYKDMLEEAVGGDKTKVTASDFGTVEGGWGKSAYMLVYERRTQDPIREVKLQEKTEAAEEKQEQVELVHWNEIPPKVPDWINTMVKRDNIDFVIDQQVFHIQFFQLVKLIMDHIANNLVMFSDKTKIHGESWSELKKVAMKPDFEQTALFASYRKDQQIKIQRLIAAQQAQGDSNALLPRQSAQAITYDNADIHYFKQMKCISLGIAQKVLFDFVIHFGENGDAMPAIVDRIITMFCDSYITFTNSDSIDEAFVLFEFIQKNFLEDDCKYLFDIMFAKSGPSDATRQNIGRLVSSVINLAFRVLGICWQKDLKGEKVQQMGQMLDKFMKKIMKMLHEKDTQSNWRKLEAFNKMVMEIGTGGKLQAEWLLKKNQFQTSIEKRIEDEKAEKAKKEAEKDQKEEEKDKKDVQMKEEEKEVEKEEEPGTPRDTILDLCDIVMQFKSPKAKDEPIPRYDMGSSYTEPYFGPLVKLASHLVRCCHTERINPEASTFMKFKDLQDRTAPKAMLKEKFMMDEDTWWWFFTNPALIEIIIKHGY